MQPPGAAVKRGERRSRVQTLSGSSMFEAFEEAAMVQLRVFGDKRRGGDCSGRNSRARKYVDHRIQVLYGEPLAELRVARQLRQRVALGVGVHADRDPVVVA